MNIARLWLDRTAARLAPREKILGKATMIFSIGMSCLGVPSQIAINYFNKSCGLNFWLIMLLLAMFVARIPYTVSKRAYAILPADFIGFAAALVLLAQWFWY